MTTIAGVHPPRPRRSAVALSLHGMGIVVTLWTAVAFDLAERPLAVLPVVTGSLCWILALLLPRRLRTAAWCVTVAFGAIGIALGSTSGSPLVVVGVLTLVATPAVPLLVAALVVLGALALALVGTLTPDVGAVWDSLPTLLLWLVVGVVFGLLRRQRVLELAAERDRLVTQALDAAATERGRIARELHDVLAHTLGGLVIQLDATEALLEHRGIAPELVARVAASRGLAKDGLAEAKRAVEALRGFDEPLSDVVSRLATALEAATDVPVRLVEEGAARPLPPAVVEALAGVCREALTNAARYGDGAAVSVELRWSSPGVGISIAQPMPAGRGTRPRSPGGGHGMRSIRERAESIGAACSIGVERVDGGAWWVVSCEVDDGR